VAQVGHRGCPKGALGALEVESVRPERREEDTNVLQVLSP
jgi:hypothetical protein